LQHPGLASLDGRSWIIVELTFRVFISSPGDAMVERRRCENVISRLNGEVAGLARLVAVRWETEFYQAHATFQTQISPADACDIILKWRLGTELPPDFDHLPDGTPYPSGTPYELLAAIDKRRARPRRCRRLPRAIPRRPAELAALLGHADAGAVRPILNALTRIGERTKDQDHFGRPVRCDLVLLVDQLEEMLAPSVAPELRKRFAQLLTELRHRERPDRAQLDPDRRKRGHSGGSQP
jgi:hypothetical protein